MGRLCSNLSGRIVRPLLTLIALSTLFGCSNPEEEARLAALAEGEAIVKKNCFVCHGQGINGAPIIGNSKMWAPRLEKGKEALVQSAMNGFGLMPPKGGNTELEEADIQLAVGYMMSQATPEK